MADTGITTNGESETASGNGDGEAIAAALHDVDTRRASQADGMVDASLKNLVEGEFVEVEVAYAASPNPQELKMRLKGISSGAGSILG